MNQLEKELSREVWRINMCLNIDEKLPERNPSGVFVWGIMKMNTIVCRAYNVTELF